MNVKNDTETQHETNVLVTHEERMDTNLECLDNLDHWNLWRKDGGRKCTSNEEPHTLLRFKKRVEVRKEEKDEKDVLEFRWTKDKIYT